MKLLVLGACAIIVVGGAALYDDPLYEGYDDRMPERFDNRMDDRYDDIPLYALQDPWVNSYDGAFDFKCPTGQGITNIKSTKSFFHGDRKFDFTCEFNAAITEQCYDSGYENVMKGDLDYKCKAGHVVAGVKSYHKNGLVQDRRFGFHCCKVISKLDHCGNSGYVNNYNNDVNYGDAGRFITGMKSTYSGWNHDRRWVFYYCEVDQPKAKVVRHIIRVTHKGLIGK